MKKFTPISSFAFAHLEISWEIVDKEFGLTISIVIYAVDIDSTFIKISAKFLSLKSTSQETIRILSLILKKL